MATEQEYLDALFTLDKVWRADRGNSDDRFGDGYSFAYKMALLGLIESLKPGTLDRVLEETAKKAG